MMKAMNFTGFRTTQRAQKCVPAAKRRFDEGAAQVANLLKRDEAELTGKAGIGASAYETFEQEAGEDRLANVDEFPDAFKPAAGGDVEQKAPKKKRAAAAFKPSQASPFGEKPTTSPFGSAPLSPGSPFMDSTPTAGIESKLAPDMEADPISEAPWWTRITAGQIFLFFTFSTMTLSMLATVAIVAKTGAIHFNDDNY